ncbi:hypothetical protein BGX34_010618 [Mortierella sp. NVP85]|nr:hypothetical protein BGX34_010618 [Mortierella sp. NVP85]
MPPRNPFYIPEITSLVAPLLGQSDLASCVRVCKTWQDIFFPHLWRSIDVHAELDFGSKPRRIGPSQDDIYNHRHLIHDLSLEGELVSFNKECYPNLRSLDIGFRSADCLENPVETISLNLIKTFPSLVCLRFGCVDLTPEVWMTLSSHPHIKRLELTAVPIRNVDAPAFWKVCEKLEHLELTYVKLRDLTIPADTVFHRIRHLEIEGGQQPDLQGQMDLILRCPSSEYIKWHIEEEDDIYEQRLIHNPIRKDHWPRLKELTITYPIHDTDIAAILQGAENGLGNIVELYLNCTVLMDQAFKAISHHFSTLVIVSLFGCHPDTSPAIRDILCGCPKLEILRGTSIYARDIVEGGPWVCLQLKALMLCFLVEDTEQELQPLIFERLSTLTRLEVLTMWAPPMNDNGQDKVLRFRLDCGMTSLASLRQLTFIHFGRIRRWSMCDDDVSYCPQLGMDEILWIEIHWKRLRMVQGRLNENKRLEEQLISRLQSRGIEYCP